jgi:hypothetical protein
MAITYGMPVSQPQPLADPAAKPVSPNLAPWSAERIEAWHRADAARKRWAGPPPEHPAIGAHRQAEEVASRDQLAEDVRKAQWPDPRRQLRERHTQLLAAQGVRQRRQEAVAAISIRCRRPRPP